MKNVYGIEVAYYYIIMYVTPDHGMRHIGGTSSVQIECRVNTAMHKQLIYHSCTSFDIYILYMYIYNIYNFTSGDKISLG